MIVKADAVKPDFSPQFPIKQQPFLQFHSKQKGLIPRHGNSLPHFGQSPSDVRRAGSCGFSFCAQFANSSAIASTIFLSRSASVLNPAIAFAFRACSRITSLL
jgi:hypothetical protein